MFSELVIRGATKKCEFGSNPWEYDPSSLREQLDFSVSLKTGSPVPWNIS